MQDLVLNQIYKASSIIEDAIEFGAPIDSHSKRFANIIRQKAISFKKETLLHLFIKQEFLNYYEHFFTQMTNGIPDEVLELILLENQFAEYDITINFLQINYDKSNNLITTSRQIISWYNKNKSKFITLSDKICEDVFFILFSNKRLLHKFNETLSRDFKEFGFSKINLTFNKTLKRKAIPPMAKKSSLS